TPEFTQTPKPNKTVTWIKEEENPAKLAALFAPDIVDEFLDFGPSQMVPGFAFALEAGDKRPEETFKQFPVGKRWLKQGTRNILIEDIEYVSIKPILAQLAAATPKGQAADNGSCTWPDSPPADSAATPMHSGVLPSEPGVV